MNVSDDSDEDIFDASARQASGSESTGSIVDEMNCEVVQLPISQNGQDLRLEPDMPTHLEATIPTTDIDSDYKCDSENSHRQDTAILTPLGLVECVGSSGGANCSIATEHCDATDQMTDSLSITDCTVKLDSSLASTETTETISSQPEECTDARDSVNCSEPDDELLAELENEFCCLTMAQSASVLSDYGSVNGCLSSHADQVSNDNDQLTLVLDSLQRRQQALECRLQNTLEAKKQLESENVRLECKLSAQLEALETAKQDMESAKLQVWDLHV